MPEPNLRQELAAALAKGCLGILCVRVVAAYDLVNADTDMAEGDLSDAYVRVTQESQTARTAVEYNSLSPRWDAGLFVFHVTSLSAMVTVSVLDSDIVKDDPLGDLSLCVADLPVLQHAEVADDDDNKGASERSHNICRSLCLPHSAIDSCTLPTHRYKLLGVARGELELQLALFVGKEIPMPLHDPDAGPESLGPVCWRPICLAVQRWCRRS